MTEDVAASIPLLERAAGSLASASVARMDETLPWFRTLPADQRSWITLLAQNGVRAFTDWLRDPHTDAGVAIAEVSTAIFAEAPRELTRSLPLEHTLALIKVTIDVTEEHVAALAPPAERTALLTAVLRYSREVAFAAATVYAKAAETRGSWDTRLQALLVDALLSDRPDNEIASRAAALGWRGTPPIVVVVGTAKAGHTAESSRAAEQRRQQRSELESTLDALARAGRNLGIETLASVHGDRLIVVLAGASDPMAAGASLASAFGPGPIVIGDPVQALPEATISARSAEAAAAVAATWPDAPRPVSARDLLPERAIAGDSTAATELLRAGFRPLAADPTLLTTARAYLDAGGGLEATARALFVHPNTVRYRIRRIAALTGLDPARPRDAFALRIALVLGTLANEGHPNAMTRR